MSRKMKNYTDDFKKQIVALKQNGKRTAELVEEYDVAASTVMKWVNDYNKSGSFKAKDNRTEQENELIELRKKVKYLEMEVDILKQAALVMAQK